MEPMPGLAAPRGREDVAVALSLLPSQFRSGRKGPADKVQAPGPLVTLILSIAQAAGLALGFPAFPLPHRLSHCFSFLRASPWGAGPGKWGEEE